MKVFVVTLRVVNGKEVFDYLEHVASSKERANEFIDDRLLYRAACGYNVTKDCSNVPNMVALFSNGSSSGAFYIYEKEIDKR